MKVPDRTVVFIHGFGSRAKVWAKLIRLIRDDPDLGGVQTFTFSYPSRVIPRLPFSPTRTPGYDDIAQLLETRLAVEVPDDDIAIVTHSQGGLILQRFLVRMLDDGYGRKLARIRLIVMLVCPNEGSGYLGPMRTAAGFRHHPQGRDLGPFSRDVAETLRRVLSGIDRAQGVGPHHCHIPMYAYAGSEDNVVPPTSAQSGFTNRGVLAGDHRSILDPDTAGNFTFRVLKELLHKHFLPQAETENVPTGQNGESSVGPARARPALPAAAPLIEETLDLTLTSDGIQVVHLTEGGPDGRTLLPVPSAEAMEDYHRALREAVALTAPADDATTRRIRGLVRPLQQALLLAAPDSLRQRLAETAGQAGRLVAIELRLMNSELEAYPWELMADVPDLVVWRNVSSPGLPERWTSNVLLTGTAGVREVRDELAEVKSELSGQRHLAVYERSGSPADLSQLLRRYRPAVLHLVSYPAGQQRIQLASVAADLRQYGAWTAVFNCPYSATVSLPDGCPPASEIAARSGAATIGMAGQMNPVAGQLFATGFYHYLARGFSVLQAYHEGVRAIRDHGIYSVMWSIPVMYADSAKVIPFPVSSEARARLGLEQIRLHVTALDRELQRLAGGNYRSAGEWARQAATPIVRTQCIVRYLDDDGAASRPAASEQERRRQERLDRAREDFRSVLNATEASLRRLGSAVGSVERRKELAELPRRRRRHLGMLDDLVKEVR